MAIRFTNILEDIKINVRRNITGEISDDRTVVGVGLEYSERDMLRRDVVNKLSQISLPVPTEVYSFLLVEVYDDDMKIIADKYVVELTYNPIRLSTFFQLARMKFLLKLMVERENLILMKYKLN